MDLIKNFFKETDQDKSLTIPDIFLSNDFNYNLETDDIFDNAQKIKPNKFADVFFFGQDTKKLTTCLLKHKIDNITTVNKLIVARQYDAIKKPFLRLKLKNNVDIKKLLNILIDCNIELFVGNTCVVKIPKILFIFLLCEELKKNIQIYNPKEFIDSHTREEISELVHVNKIENKCSYNMKYMYDSINDKYLDIPMLFEFFCYDMRLAIYGLPWHNIYYSFNIPQHRLEEFKQYVDTIYFLHELCTYNFGEPRGDLSQKRFDYMSTTQKYNYLPNYDNSCITINCDKYLKFIYVIMRSDNEDVTNMDYPTIEDVEIVTENNTYTLDKHYYYVADYEKFRVYGFAADPNCDMKKWTKVTEEIITDEKMDDNKDMRLNNLNKKPLFNVIEDASTVTIKLSSYTCLVNIEYICMHATIIQQKYGGLYDFKEKSINGIVND